ncbi:YybH family protein [Vibrio vulnificus]|uniref:YybH family protein n=2 Tax=Vibrio vulnificus TaxID=672 RepID=UPI0013EE4083|nr:nuclear transport factor 2 family protein [Vibrio vulnificus]
MKKDLAMRNFIIAIFLVTMSYSTIGNNLDSNLNKINEAFNTSIETQDVDGLMDLYGEEVIWIAPGKVMSTNGREEAYKLFSFMTSNNANVTHDIDHLFVSNDGTLSVMIGDVLARAESLGINGKGTYLYVLRKDEVDWKITLDMWNQVPSD